MWVRHVLALTLSSGLCVACSSAGQEVKHRAPAAEAERDAPRAAPGSGGRAAQDQTQHQEGAAAGSGSVEGGEKMEKSTGKTPGAIEKVVKSDEEWRKILTPAQYHVMREQGTERAFTGAYWSSHDKALYVCAACGLELFRSDEKFDSGTGWPSFWQPIRKEVVAVETDESHGMVRSEVHCARCGGHLGHVFDDGPRPTGLRYCINSASLKQVPQR